MSTTKSVEKDLLYSICNLFSSHDSPNREAITNSFSHSNDVWLDALPFMAPVFGANTAKACLNFVTDN